MGRRLLMFFLHLRIFSSVYFREKFVNSFFAGNSQLSYVTCDNTKTYRYVRLKTAPTVATRNRCSMTFVRAKRANIVRGSAADDAVHAVRADVIESAVAAAIDVERCVRILLALPIHRFGVVKVDADDGDCMSAHVERASRRLTVATHRTYISELASSV